MKKKIVVLTGAGMSVESGLRTFRDADGLWEEYPVAKVATHEGWEADPTLVTNFYNMLRKKCWGVKPNEGHKLVAALEEKYDVTVVTQNVDNLHEQAGSSKVIHLHGELMKVCSSRDVDNPAFQQTLTPDNCEIAPGTKAGDGSLLRPFIAPYLCGSRRGPDGRHIYCHWHQPQRLSRRRTAPLCASRCSHLSHRPQPRQCRFQCQADTERCQRRHARVERDLDEIKKKRGLITSPFDCS